ncbi:MAG: hypothetical protein QOE14_394, partial [Humisphaera sp.]|nr:hypothetical protein [Humisphaera sp.]
TPAQVEDSNLVTPWGLAPSTTGPWWVANQGTGTSTLYNTSTDQVTINPLVVDVPPNPGGGIFPDSPTGIVFNGGGTGFNVTGNGKTGSSVFLFDNADGTISGWSPGVDLTNAIIGAVSPRANTIYLGLAIATDRHGETRLYAADFYNNVIDVYDTNFDLVTNLRGNFTDSKLPADYHAFNIQAIDNELYVAYAPAGDILAGTAGPGQGAVSVYNTEGKLENRLIRPGNTHINQPWAIVKAPSKFGSFSNELLIGNFGDGTISAFNPRNGHFDDKLEDANGDPIAIRHLWGLAFGNGAAAGPKNTLFFTAGLTSHLAPGDAPFHGLFGSLEVATRRTGHSALSVPAPATSSPTTPSSLLTGVLRLNSTSTIDFLDGDHGSLLI